MEKNALLEIKRADVGKDIGQEEGYKMVTAYREANPDAVPGYFIGRDILEKVLNQPDCVGITFRKALNDAGEEHLVYTGVNTDGKDILAYPVITPNGDIENHDGIVGDRIIWDWDIFFPPKPPQPPVPPAHH